MDRHNPKADYVLSALERNRQGAEPEKRMIKLGPFQIDPVIKLKEIAKLLVIMIPLATALAIPGWRLVLNSLRTQESLAEINNRLNTLQVESDEMNKQIGNLKGQLDHDRAWLEGYLSGKPQHGH
jgi:hypothetical protein